MHLNKYTDFNSHNRLHTTSPIDYYRRSTRAWSTQLVNEKERLHADGYTHSSSEDEGHESSRFSILCVGSWKKNKQTRYWKCPWQSHWKRWSTHAVIMTCILSHSLVKNKGVHNATRNNVFRNTIYELIWLCLIYIRQCVIIVVFNYFIT